MLNARIFNEVIIELLFIETFGKKNFKKRERKINEFLILKLNHVCYLIVNFIEFEFLNFFNFLNLKIKLKKVNFY